VSVFRRIGITAYTIGVVIILAVLSGRGMGGRTPGPRGLNVFSAGVALRRLGLYTSKWLYGYRRVV